MNCSRARQLISPYLDHQLSEREKEALQGHLLVCTLCDQERQSIRQVKLMLRGLSGPRLPQDFSRNFSETVALRLDLPAGPSWQVLCLAPPRPQRGRRLATAIALSCLTIVSFALPFAPDSHDTPRASAGFASGGPAFALPASTDALLPDQPADHLLPASPLPADFNAPRGDMLILTDMGTSGFALRPPAAEAPLGNSQFAVFRPR